jgi:hypothetical protein
LVEDELWVGNFGDEKINNYDPVTAISSRRFIKPMGLHSDWMVCGIFSLRRTESFSLPESQMKSTVSLASSLRIKTRISGAHAFLSAA